MPLGAVTSLFWQPKHRILSFLIAFGAGALLAAVIVDLVGSAQEKGHYLALVAGAILGSLFFTLVNKIVNESGGFLRKPSTMLVHLNQQKSRHFQSSLDQLKRIDLFRQLSADDTHFISQRLLLGNYPKNTVLYQPDDPSESLYIIRKGAVELLDPLEDWQPHIKLKSNDIFGRMGFLTGTSHQMLARTTSDTELWIFPKPDFEELLQVSPHSVEVTKNLLQGEEIANYLRKRHEMKLPDIKDWVSRAIASLGEDRAIPDAVPNEHNAEDFLEIARQIRRFPLFEDLPTDELEEISERLVYRSFDDGYVFFKPKEIANHLYLIHRGEVELIDTQSPGKTPPVVRDRDAFGVLSFITGAPHTMTGVAKTDVKGWVLRKQDFQEMIQQSEYLERSLENFLSDESVKAYLENKQDFDPKKARRWVEKALQSMNAGEIVPSVVSASKSLEEHEDAPTAIWLGLLMDGIPEALTIGAHMATGPLSASLLAGLFISNYPEALSSSTGMKEQGFAVPRILVMWTSIMVTTGVLAAVGSFAFANVPETWISFLESMAAGAMLTVISETMLPEAYGKGGSIVGLSTILGFLTIILIRAIDPNNY